ncbi:hypothetical protein [Curtobacterium flaccumfaciens]|uniref:hypothetical protein n=1 Tax=Curtobacterium flaccumfaciens TaxID=2035 RepID=UPI0005AD00AD|nr:hypothetical protein [Curtobacterium flaccumfaciens]KIQ02453.1 hypothetical protein RU06_14740 [Curtobacterium flaccumfaciens]
MDVVALVISVLSLLVTLIGTYLTNKRSKDALAASERAASDARWSAVQEAVQRLIGFDPSAEPIQDRLANLRIAMIVLVDDLPTWAELGPWLEVERVLGATHGQVVMENFTPTDNVEQRVRNLEPLMTWAHALSQNLRLFRSTGYDAEVMRNLSTNSEALIRQLHEQYGWELPPTANPRIRPVDE